MTRLAQATQVRKVVATAVLERQDVVDFSHRRYLSLSLAVFAQRMLRDICGANLTPAPAVTLVDSRVTLKLTIVLVCLFGVELAEPFAGQFGTARRRAGTFWFAWHQPHRPLPAKTKPSGQQFSAVSPEGFVFLYFYPLTVFQALTAFSIAGFGYSITHGCKLVPAIQSYCEAVEGPVLSPVDAVTLDVEVVTDHLDSFVLVAFTQEEVFQHEPVVFS